MPLPKHLRPRWRYLAVGVETRPGADLTERAFQQAVWRSARRLLGDPGSADADPTVVRFRGDPGPGAAEAVLRVRRGEVEAARAALACVARVDGDPVGLRVRGVSGTVRACVGKYLGGPAAVSEHTDVAFGDATRPAVVRGRRVDVGTGDTFTGAADLDQE